jgi:hypothetical protein
MRSVPHGAVVICGGIVCQLDEPWSSIFATGFTAVTVSAVFAHCLPELAAGDPPAA